MFIYDLEEIQSLWIVLAKASSNLTNRPIKGLNFAAV
jgi:hypothetical protein